MKRTLDQRPENTIKAIDPLRKVVEILTHHGTAEAGKGEVHAVRPQLDHGSSAMGVPYL